MIKNFWDHKRTAEESKTPKAGKTFYSPFKVASPIGSGCKNEKIVGNKEKVVNKSLNFSGFIKQVGFVPEDCSRTERNVDFERDKGMEIRKTAGFDEGAGWESSDSRQIQSKKLAARHKKNSLSSSFNFNDVQKLRLTNSSNCSREKLKNTPKEVHKSPRPTKSMNLNLNEPEEFLSFLKTLNQSLKNKNRPISPNQELKSVHDLINDQQKAKKFFHYFGKVLDKLKTSPTILSVERFSAGSLKPVVFLQSLRLGMQVQESISVAAAKKDLSHLEKLQESLSNLETQNNELQLAVEKHKSEYFSAVDKQKSLKDSIKYLQDNVFLLREENLLLETELKSTKTTLESLSISYHSASHKSISYKKKIAELIKIIKDFQKLEYQNKPIQSTKLPIEACEPNKEILQIRENFEVLQIECRRLSNENQEFKLLAEKTRQELKESSTQNARLEREKAVLAEDVKNLTKTLVEVKSEKLKAENHFEKMQESFNEMRIENLAYKETVEILEKHCKLDSV